jgi:type III secretion protein Q
MSPLAFRKVDGQLAQARRLLGVGLALAFDNADLQGEMTLTPSVPGVIDPDADADAQWFSTRLGPIRLGDADAVLSLLGDTAVVSHGDYQPWYWQLINQQLSPQIAALLAPIQPLTGPHAEPDDGYQLRVSLGDQTLNASLASDTQTLLRLLDSAQWRALRTTLPEDWPLPQPLLIGELALSLEQLASLRPGDVLFAAHSHFDSAGNGSLNLAGQRWAAQIDSDAQPLFLRISHEEDAHHGQ